MGDDRPDRFGELSMEFVVGEVGKVGDVGDVVSR